MLNQPLKKKRGGWKRDNKGEKNPMWGKSHSKETLKKISQALKGRTGNKGSFKKGHNLTPITRKTKACIICGDTFQVKKSWAEKVKCCSRICGYKYRAKGQIGKKVHSEEFKQKLRDRNWRGGVTPKNKLIRRSEEYKNWRLHVFSRDDWTCQACGQVGGKLHADHELPFALFQDLRLEVLNGRTLCVQCHRKEPHILNHLLKLHMFDIEQKII